MWKNDSAPGLLAESISIARFHIVLIAMVATVVFGWLMTDHYLPGLALIAGVDWFVINLVNRITDIDEDLRNGIAGTARVAEKRRAFAWVAAGAMVGSLVVSILLWPWLTPFRALVQLIGIAYNLRVIPLPSGPSRFKQMYFFKNTMSAVLFVLTGFVYPLVIEARVMPWMGIVTIAGFFVLFELTYEILYDLRDLDGDRAEGVPTYPVVHGPLRARQIIDGLLIASAGILVAGLVGRWIGVREALMIAAPFGQFAVYRWRLRAGLTSRDCIGITHLGTAQLVLFLIGTAVWLKLGLPANVWL